MLSGWPAWPIKITSEVSENSEAGPEVTRFKGATIVPFGPHAQKASSSLASANSQPGAEIDLQNLDSRTEADCGNWI